MKHICFENFIGIDKTSRRFLASWLKIAEAENAGHSTAALINDHARLVSDIGGDSFENVCRRTVEALRGNRDEKDSDHVLRRLRVVARVHNG